MSHQANNQKRRTTTSAPGAWIALRSDLEERLTPERLEALIIDTDFLTERDYRSAYLLELLSKSEAHKAAFEKLIDGCVQQRGKMPEDVSEAMHWMFIAFRMGSILGFILGDDWQMIELDGD